MNDPSPITWEKVEHGYLAHSGRFTIVENYPGQFTATDWLPGMKQSSPRFPSEEEAKAWCENRLPSDPPLPDTL